MDVLRLTQQRYNLLKKEFDQLNERFAIIDKKVSFYLYKVLFVFLITSAAKRRNYWVKTLLSFFFKFKSFSILLDF